jgi:hypothetical protein
VVVQTVLLENAAPLNIWLNYTKNATTSWTMPSNLEMPKLMDNDEMDIENTIMKYNFNDVFGDLK